MTRRSGLYTGVVRHRRSGEVDHALRTRVFMGLFDLDELAALDREVRGFGHNRGALAGFHDEDHGHGDGRPLRPWLAQVTAAHGLDVTGPAQVLCMPRVAGFAFDPLSVWFCHDDRGRLSALVHEVRNTFGGRHAYVVPDPLASAVGPPPGGSEAAPGALLHHATDKAFHVSPFFDVDGDYTFTVRVPDDQAAVAIRHRAGDGHELTASFVGRRHPFTTGTLARALAAHPLLPLRVVAQIHAHALVLWRKGARYRPIPDPGPNVTVAPPTPPPAATDAARQPSTPRLDEVAR